MHGRRPDQRAFVVADRLKISGSTVRRCEGTRLHPTIDQNDVRWFDEREVAALAAELIRRFGAGTLRVTAYGFGPDEVLWEVLVEGPPLC